MSLFVAAMQLLQLLENTGFFQKGVLVANFFKLIYIMTCIENVTGVMLLFLSSLLRPISC